MLDESLEKFQPLLLKNESMLQSKNTIDDQLRDKLMNESQQHCGIKVNTTPNTAERPYEGTGLKISQMKCPNSSLQVSDSMVTGRGLRGLSAVSGNTTEVDPYPLDRSKRLDSA